MKFDTKQIIRMQKQIKTLYDMGVTAIHPWSIHLTFERFIITFPISEVMFYYQEPDLPFRGKSTKDAEYAMNHCMNGSYIELQIMFGGTKFIAVADTSEINKIL